MLLKSIVLPVLFACFLSLPMAYTQAPRNTFAEYGLFSTSFGADKDWVGDRQTLWEHAYFWDQRAGISLSPRFYAGFLAQIIRADNFEIPVQTFYTAGVWGRYYFIQAFTEKARKRWGLYAETGFQTGNYSYDYNAGVRYFKKRSDQFYYQGRFGVEYRIWKNLSVETAVQLMKPTNGNWDLHGTGYFSAGLSWRPQRY